MYMNDCGGEGMYFPVNECEDCDALIARVEALEEKILDLREVSFSKTDGDSQISGVFLGRAESNG